MIISEKQIAQLIQAGHVYLSVVDAIDKVGGVLLTDCGQKYRQQIASLLMQIADQQPEELRDINE